MSLLNNVTKGKRVKPIAVLLHGVHGIGKSTFGSNAKNAIFIGSEENDELDTSRFPKVELWEDFINQLETLKTEEHEFNTVVIDTIDSLEQVAQKAILTGNDKNKTMATAMGGFGKAYEKMRDMFLDVRDNYLIPLRDQKNMNIVLLAHSEKVKHEDPITNTQYDHYQTAIHKKIKPVFEDWVSAILFANFELYKAEREHDGKEYALGDGERRVFTEERPSHIAKNRFNLEYEMPLDWKTFAKGVAEYYKDAKKAEVKKPKEEKVNDEAQELKYQIESMMTELEGSTLERVSTAYKRAKNDIDALLKVKKRLEKTLA
jgi:hypothetical protein